MTGAIERIVVALDAASETRAAIRTAARLAARWQAHLHGIFVEDDDLIRLAHLPFARQVTIGGVEALDLRQAERQMRAVAERTRQALAASARRHGVEWSFEIARGGASDLEVSTGDFVVAGTTTRPIGKHFRVEGRWWSVAQSGSAARLLAHHDSDPNGAVAVVLRRREARSERLLATAARLAEANGTRLTVICPAALAEASDFKAWLDACLAGHAVEIELDLMPEPAILHRRITELSCRLVAIEADSDDAHPDRLRELVAKISCDVLIVG